MKRRFRGDAALDTATYSSKKEDDILESLQLRWLANVCRKQHSAPGTKLLAVYSVWGQWESYSNKRDRPSLLQFICLYCYLLEIVSSYILRSIEVTPRKQHGSVYRFTSYFTIALIDPQPLYVLSAGRVVARSPTVRQLPPLQCRRCYS